SADRDGLRDSVVGIQALDGCGEVLLGLLACGLLRLLFEPHGDQLSLALGLFLHLGDELAPRLLGGETSDHLELSPLLVDRLGETAFLLDDRFLPVVEAPVLRRVFVEPALDVVELAGQLLLLGEDALFDLLDLALAPADLVLELAARLQHDLLGFQVSRAVARFGVALGVADDAGGARARVTELAFADELLEQEPDKEGDDRDYGEQKPKWLSHRYVNPQRGCVVRRKYLSDLTV